MKPIRTQAQTKYELELKKKAEAMTLASVTHIYEGKYPCAMLAEGRGILHKFVVFFKEGKAIAWVKNSEIESIAEFTARQRS